MSFIKFIIYSFSCFKLFAENIVNMAAVTAKLFREMRV